MQFRILVISVASALIFTACKKNKQDVMATQPTTTPPATLTDDALKDSVFLLTKDIYLWNTQLPSTFNARGYDDPDKIMEAIRQYSTEPGFAQPVDRYSFAIKKTEWDNISEGMSSLEGTASTNGDFGLTVFF